MKQLQKMAWGMVVAVAATGAAAGLAVGCSSSSTGTGNNNGTDSGTHYDSGTSADTGTGSQDAGTGTKDSGAADTGTVTSSCPSTKTFTPPTYVAAPKGNGQCAPADIAAFVAACGYDNGSQALCTAWLNTNAPPVDGGAGGTTCGSCIIPAKNDNGGIWLDPEGFINPNYAGCIQLEDTTNGTACATAYNNFFGCQDLACDDCTSDDAGTACATTVNAGACKTYFTTANSACATDLADGGAAGTCTPSNVSGDPDDDFTFTINAICGTGP